MHEQIVLKKENLTDGLEQGLLECQYCQKLYSHPVSLKNHLVSHSDRFRCSKCDTGFISKVQLDKHNCETVMKKKQKEAKQSETIYECEQCGMRFGSRNGYRDHKVEHTDKYRCSSLVNSSSISLLLYEYGKPIQFDVSKIYLFYLLLSLLLLLLLLLFKLYKPQP